MTLLTDIADLAEELCDPRQHTEIIWGWSTSRHREKLGEHKTIQPGLLTQLHEAIAPLLAGLDDAGARGVPRSTPPLQIEALDRWLDITVKAATWCHTLGVRPRLTPQDNIRALIGANLGDHANDLRADLRRWRGWCATITGWETTFSPDNPCPVEDCNQRGTLRINLARQTAYCTACRSWWDEDTIQGLAIYLNAGQHHRPTPARVGSSIAGHGGWTGRIALGG